MWRMCWKRKKKLRWISRCYNVHICVWVPCFFSWNDGLDVTQRARFSSKNVTTCLRRCRSQQLKMVHLTSSYMLQIHLLHCQINKDQRKLVNLTVLRSYSSPSQHSKGIQMAGVSTNEKFYTSVIKCKTGRRTKYTASYKLCPENEARNSSRI